MTAPDPTYMSSPHIQGSRVGILWVRTKVQVHPSLRHHTGIFTAQTLPPLPALEAGQLGP